MDAMPTRHIDPPADIRSALVMLSMDPHVVPEKIAALWKVQREMEADRAQVEYTVAMNAVQAEIEPVVRDTMNDQTRSMYAKQGTIHAAIQPIYCRHGFTLEFDTEEISDTHIRVILEVSHIGGHTKRRQMPGAHDTAGFKGTPNKTAIQGVGSTVTYLRRYLTLLAFNVPLADDNDGNRPAPNNGRLSEAQVEELELLMRQTRTSEGKFLAHMLPDLRSITQAPADDFPRLKTALLLKQRLIAQREQNGARP